MAARKPAGSAMRPGLPAPVPEDACTWCAHGRHDGACPEMVMLPLEVGARQVRTVGNAVKLSRCRCALRRP